MRTLTDEAAHCVGTIMLASSIVGGTLINVCRSIDVQLRDTSCLVSQV